MHGIFNSDAFRAAYLGQFGVRSSVEFDAGVDLVLNQLAEHVEAYMDVDLLLSLAQTVR